MCLHIVNGFKYSKLLTISIWVKEGTLTGTTTPGQSGTESNGTPYFPKLQEWSLAITGILMSYPGPAAR